MLGVVLPTRMFPIPPVLFEEVVIEFEVVEAEAVALVLLLFVLELLAVDLGLTMVVTPAGLVLRRTFLVLGSLLSFLYFMRRFWNQILICRSDKQRA